MAERPLTAEQEAAAQRLANEHGQVHLGAYDPFRVDVYGDLNGALHGAAYLGRVRIDPDGQETWL